MYVISVNGGAKAMVTALTSIGADRVDAAQAIDQIILELLDETSEISGEQLEDYLRSISLQANRIIDLEVESQELRQDLVETLPE